MVCNAEVVSTPKVGQHPLLYIVGVREPCESIQQCSKPHKVSVTSQFRRTPKGVQYVPMSPRKLLHAHIVQGRAGSRSPVIATELDVQIRFNSVC